MDFKGRSTKLIYYDHPKKRDWNKSCILRICERTRLYALGGYLALVWFFIFYNGYLFFCCLFFVCLFFLFNNSYHIKWSIQTVVSLFHLFLNKYKSDKAYHNLFLILESSDYIHCIKSNFLVPGPSNHQGTWLSKHELQTMFYCSFSIIPQGMRVYMSCAIPAHWTIEMFDYSK